MVLLNRMPLPLFFTVHFICRAVPVESFAGTVTSLMVRSGVPISMLVDASPDIVIFMAGFVHAVAIVSRQVHIVVACRNMSRNEQVHIRRIKLAGLQFSTIHFPAQVDGCLPVEYGVLADEEAVAPHPVLR